MHSETFDSLTWECEKSPNTSAVSEVYSLSPDLGPEWHFNEVFQDLQDLIPPEVDLMSSHIGDQSGSLSGFPSGDDLKPEATDGNEPVASSDILEEAFRHVEKLIGENDLDVPTTVFDVEGDIHADALSSVPDTPKTPQRCQRNLKETPKRTRHAYDPTPYVKPKPHETRQQAVRRVKNNVASKDFRSRRKAQLDDLLGKEEKLRADNQQMKKDLLAVEEVVQLLKEGLIQNTKLRRNKL